METSAIGGVSYQPERAANKQQDLGQADFLRLMITQFQNQDPFQPLESGEFLGQIAQFSTVSGIEQLNASFADLSSALASDQTLQGAALVGRSALVATNRMVGAGGETVGGIVDLSEAASVSLEVYDQVGQLVRQIPLGQQAAGPVPFQWDGRSNDGTQLSSAQYNFVARVTGSGQSYAAPIQLQGRIDSVSIGGAGGLAFNIAGLGAVSFADIRQIN